jgi:wobble nucleotide-excising tRNase
MISKINKVQNFGVFSDFNWEPLLNNFKTKNILYGWNYSGKTTLSRLFSYIEKHSIDGNPDIQFEIENSDGEKFSEKDLLTCPLQIRVFNTIILPISCTKGTLS